MKRKSRDSRRREEWLLWSCVGFSTNKTIFGCVELNVSVGLSRQVEGVISEVTVLSLSYHVKRQKYPSNGSVGDF